MIWLRMWWAHILAYGFSAFVLSIISASYVWEIQYVWTDGTTKCDIASTCGILYFSQNEGWWRVERPTILYGPSVSPSPIDTWVGMRIDRQTQLLGFTYATGKWISPFIQATRDTKYTAPRFSRDPGMYMSTTPVRVYAVPYSFFLLFPLTYMLTYYFRKFRLIRQAELNLGT
jgi:hypothetical protein